MTQQKSNEKNLLNDRDCASKVGSHGYSANHSTAPECHDTHLEILEAADEFMAGNGFDLSSPPAVPKYIRDVETLPLSDLKKAYPKEHNSWRNRRPVAQKLGLPFYQPWEDFRVFLRELGPIPVEGYTLDKLEPAKGYVPGNVRWASKSTQTHNRPNTVWLAYAGDKQPLGIWAKRTGQPESTLRSRRKAGWSDEQIITGVPPAKVSVLPHKYPWPVGQAQQWEARFQRDTGGHADRLWYLAHTIATNLKEHAEEVDTVFLPEDYSPSMAELDAAAAFNRAYTHYEKLWYHVQREAKRRGLPALSITDYMLNHYR